MRHWFSAAVVAGGLFCLVGCGGSDLPVIDSREELPVEGYIVADDTAAATVERDAESLAVVGVDGVGLTPDGTGLTALPQGAAAVVETARQHDLTTELLLTNYDDEIGDFSPEIAGRMLNDPEHRAAVITALVQAVADGGYDGVQLDLESLDESHVHGLVAFAGELRRALPSEARISMAVMSSPDPDDYARQGYTRLELQRVVDRFVLMAYDHHTPGSSGPGPVGPQEWTQDVLDTFLETGMPAWRVDLGIAQYGYVWAPEGSEDAPGRDLSVAEAREMAGAAARYDDESGEWTARLDDGRVLWWSDERSLADRYRIAQDAEVHGVAVWSLGHADGLTINP